MPRYAPRSALEQFGDEAAEVAGVPGGDGRVVPAHNLHHQVLHVARFERVLQRR